MKSTTKWMVASQVAALPWIVVFLVWLTAMNSFTRNMVYVPVLVLHNCFMHEWYGRCTLGFSIVVLAIGVWRGPRKLPAITTSTLYLAWVLVLAGYTIWWAATGQQYEW